MPSFPTLEDDGFFQLYQQIWTRFPGGSSHLHIHPDNLRLHHEGLRFVFRWWKWSRHGSARILGILGWWNCGTVRSKSGINYPELVELWNCSFEIRDQLNSPVEVGSGKTIVYRVLAYARWLGMGSCHL